MFKLRYETTSFIKIKLSSSHLGQITNKLRHKFYTMNLKIDFQIQEGIISMWYFFILLKSLPLIQLQLQPKHFHVISTK